MWNSRYLFLLVMVLFSGPLLAQNEQLGPPDRTYDAILESGYLNVGVYQNFPPYSYLQDDEPAGVDVELGRQIAAAMGVEFRVHWIVPDETLEDDLRNNVWKGHYLAKTRIADVMLRVPYDKTFAYMRDSTGEVINDQVVMFGPYQREQWQIAFDSTQLESVPTMAVFQYHHIGVQVDTLPDFYLTSAFAGRMRDKTRHYRNIAEAFEAMVGGEVTAVMGMRSEIDFELARQDGDRLQSANNGFPGITKQVWDIGMAVKHTHRQLGYAIEAIVDGMVRNGEVASIYEAHGLRYSIPGFYEDILNASVEE
ncbi:substrate-binding periplasmic protein [Marinobacter zhejiangensis]|uniref:Amino acid ABC transporter substrate-binding protein, PAAT family (TC 3.A.1.3.-) n=1 Tax=Marinobacter zhejiangensis TaxID=488535 RepID=A0A1I4SGL0_9GAMM|nr:transporter substrate-binding domain-containing protein [Marinobacter zhejiangensis]SFM63433.1 amino acid ABC transporter substrate-binding protein, PAAT family (TC 3.A.1.3.-) [Marinobacter zhejiangensis]